MNKQIFLEILKRSAWLSLGLMLSSLGVLSAMKADLFWTVVGTILVPVGNVLLAIVRVWYKNRGKITLAEVDAEFDKVQPK